MHLLLRKAQANGLSWIHLLLTGPNASRLYQREPQTSQLPCFF
jgi:hypothetical protein